MCLVTHAFQWVIKTVHFETSIVVVGAKMRNRLSFHQIKTQDFWWQWFMPHQRLQQALGLRVTAIPASNVVNTPSPLTQLINMALHNDACTTRVFHLNYCFHKSQVVLLRGVDTYLSKSVCVHPTMWSQTARTEANMDIRRKYSTDDRQTKQRRNSIKNRNSLPLLKHVYTSNTSGDCGFGWCQLFCTTPRVF